MSNQSYLIDTNVIFGLEDHAAVRPAFSALVSLAAKHKIDVFVHAAARDDIARDRDAARRGVSLSKLEKFQTLAKVRGLTREALDASFGPLDKDNDVVDATLLHALDIGVADFLVTEDRGLHDRARRHSAELGRRILFVADAVSLLQTTYEPVETPIRYVEELSAHTIPTDDPLFESLRSDYPPFDEWWREKCVRQRRNCWVIYDDERLAGLVVRKDETGADTDAVTKAPKILKICTMKVGPESRGVKLGELLLKKVLWFAQANGYDLAYLTTFPRQEVLMDLLEYYGFKNAGTLPNGELIYEKRLGKTPLDRVAGISDFDVARLNYPRFISRGVRGFGVPIIEEFHDTLFPDLKAIRPQGELFNEFGQRKPLRPGNTIRKVYLCRAQSRLGAPGSLLFFYKGKSSEAPSQAMTAIGIFEDFALARSVRDLMQLTAGRSVYSERQLALWEAEKRPVKVINFLLAAYIEPPVGLPELYDMNVFAGHPAQSIFELDQAPIEALLARGKLGFRT